MSNTPHADEARAVLLRRIDGLVSDLRQANSELRRHQGIHADREVAAINRTISEYESLRSRVSGLR
jgi:flagellar hook-associated protein FlgK